MKEVIYQYTQKLINDSVVKRRIYLITVACAVLLALVILRENGETGKYLYDDSGKLEAIYREDLGSKDSYNLNLVIGGEDGESRQVIISPSIQREDDKAIEESNENGILRNAEIAGIISRIENSQQNRIELPEQLNDGTELIWSEIEEGEYEWAYVLTLYVFLLVMIVAGTAEHEKAETEKLRYEIVRCVPRFTNQMLLLLNAGLIMNDAFYRVCSAYECIPELKRRRFESMMIELCSANRDNQVPTSALIRDFGARYNVKEFVRLSAFMSENERKGSNIIESLDRESRFLWDERKAVAREKGRLIDTRMTYPLGLLLIMLIVITMAPAMLAM